MSELLAALPRLPEPLASLPPGWIALIGALLLLALPRSARRAATVVVPILALWQCIGFTFGPGPATPWSPEVLGHTLELWRVDGLSRPFGLIFHIALLLGAIYAAHVDDRVQQWSALVYGAAGVGAVYAGDLLTLFFYWELTAVASVFLIWARRTETSFRTGLRYLIIQIGSGVLLLTGALQRLHATGSLSFEHIGLAGAGGVAIFLAFGIKSAFPLLHNWLQDAYPQGTVTGTVFLSAFTTKLAIYALARGYAGESILIPIGVVMTLFPIFFAVIENDLRKVLAYSLNNQLGFMVVGIGVGTELALNGTTAHAFAHIVYKALLFMSVGAVLHRTGTSKASELGGLHRTMPFTAACCIVGAMSIAAFPLFSGFVSKSLTMSAVGAAHLTWVMVALLAASAGVMEHSGIKIPYFAFFGHDSGKRPREAPANMLVAMGLGAAICIGLGIFPGVLYELLPYSATEEPYTASHVITQLQLLLFATLAFGVLMRTGRYPAEMPSVNLDFDWLYRRLVPDVVRVTWKIGAAFWSSVQRAVLEVLAAAVARLGALLGPGDRPELASTRTTVIWILATLGVSLLLYFCQRQLAGKIREPPTAKPALRGGAGSAAGHRQTAECPSGRIAQERRRR